MPASDKPRAPGKLWGIGLGPGDPELVTVKAARLIGEADVVAFHSARHGNSISRAIAETYMRPGQIEEHLVYPVTTEDPEHPGGYRGAIDEFYEQAAAALASHLSAGRTVALLAAGDPLFYSSYIHMHRRLAQRFEAEIVPGITSVNAAAAALGIPLVTGDQVMTVLPGTLPVAELTRRLADTDAAAILKLGRTYPSVREALQRSGRLTDASYAERVGTDRQRLLPAADAPTAGVPYFSVAIVGGTDPAQHPGGEVVVVGLGPAGPGWLTPEAGEALAKATDLVGYARYVERVPTRLGQRRHASDNREERERAVLALKLAAGGASVAVVSSGDPGIFAMAAAIVEASEDPQWRHVPVRVLPGVTAASAVASRVGAPLGHDFAVISLSDRLKPWPVVAQRISAVAAADMALAVYNPASRERTWQVAALQELLLAHRAPATPVVVGRDVGGPDESVQILTLGTLDPAVVDMRTLLIVGASTTTSFATPTGTRVYTSRSYPGLP